MAEEEEGLTRLEQVNGVRQNLSKKQVMLVLPDSRDAQGLVNFKRAVERRWPNTHVSDRVKHVGVWYQQDGGCGVELRAWAQAAKSAWRRMGAFWVSAKIWRQQCASMWRALVQSTLMSALHCRVLTESQVRSLERGQMRQLRAIMLGRARGLSNAVVCRLLRVNTGQFTRDYRRSVLGGCRDCREEEATCLPFGQP